MIKHITAVTLVLTMTGCASVQNWIPSFWDDNQSLAIITVRQTIENIDCSQPQLEQAQKLSQHIRWFQLYSESKGSLQKDVLRVVEPMSVTVSEWAKRAREKEPSRAYCDIKKKVLESQSKMAAEAVLGRY